MRSLRFLPVLPLLIAAPASAATANAKPAAPRAATPAGKADCGKPIDPLTLRRPAGGEWLGIYLLGNKAGSAFEEIAADTFGGSPAIRSEMRLSIELNVGGNVARREVIDRRWYARAPKGQLLGFEAIRSGDGGERKIEGSCSASRCTVKIHGEQGDSDREIPLPPETADAADPVRLVLANRCELQTAYLDLDELEVKEATHRFAGEEKGAFRISSTEEDEKVEMITRLAPDGRTLELQIGPGMVAKAESRDAATALGEPADVFALTQVKLPAPLPRDAQAITLVMRGLPDDAFRRDERQSYEKLANGDVRITLRRVAPAKSAALPVDGKQFAKQLEATPSIDADAPAIEKLAATLSKPGDDSFTRAARIAAYVNASLEKGYGSSSDTASRVLAEGKGDCTEHALLFVALSRAAGVPARLVHGLVRGDGDALLWHEWAEVWAGSWIAIDPTFGQPVADATHLAVGEGREGISARLMGQLSIVQAKVVAPSVDRAAGASQLSGPSAKAE